MQRKIINQLPQYPQSKTYDTIKTILSSLIQKLTNLQKDKSITNKQNYLHTFKQISWSIGKCHSNWPAEIQQNVNKLKCQLSNFQSYFLNQNNQKKGFFLCGTNNNKSKQQSLQNIYKRILSYQQIFTIISIYQDKKLKQDLVYTVLDLLQKNHGFDRSVSKVTKKPIKQQFIHDYLKQQKNNKTMCDYCQLMKSISVCPNGYIAKKLLKQLPDVQWIAGILYEQGTIVDKNINKAVQFYQMGRKKKNPQAIYRLGLLNQKGQYGQKFQYLKMWQQASKMGHLQSITDLGFIYQNGLQQHNKQIIQPNLQKALQYYSKGAQKNFPRALNNLATFYYRDTPYKNQHKCMDYFQRAAQAQYVKALYNLGIIYLQGQIGIKNQQKAKRLIKRSAEKGDLQGKQQYVQILLSQVHKCSADDLDQINMFCRQIIAEQQDNPYPYYFLGIMYEGGYGVQQEPKSALLYYTKAARYQCPEAFIKIGDCFKNGFGVEQNSKDAIRNYQKAASSLPLANVYIGQMYEKGYPDLKQNYQQAFNHYYNACNNQVPEAYTHIGQMYKHGRHVKIDLTKAQQYFRLGKQNVKKSNTNKLNSSSQLIHSSYFKGRR